ncbi:hypothetical protein KKC91_08605 [bacterium]|nr:hypothetical protein [bacterium]
MLGEKLEVLDQKIQERLQKIQEIKSERDTLRESVNSLQVQLFELDKRYKKLEESSKISDYIKEQYRIFKDDRVLIKSKINKLLKQLRKF